MRGLWRMSRALRLGLALLFVGVVFGCAVEPRPTPISTDNVRWCPAWDETRSIGDLVGEPPVFVRDEVIVIGDSDDVTEVIQEVLGEAAADERIERVELSWLEPGLPPQVPIRFGPNRRGNLVIDLYPTGQLSVGEAVQAIYITALDKGLPVFADPNYVTADPWSARGSPWSARGSPASGTLLSAAHESFWSQWAFGERGIRLLDGNGDRAVDTYGEDIRVGVFDTSPFENPGGWEIPWIQPTMPLCVSHFLQSPQTPTSDHGLFAAGLVHAVAPNSEIHLLRVLNEDAYGDLFTLIKALSSFIEQRLYDNGGTLTNTVINLSLGVQQPEDPADLDLAELQELNQLLEDLMNELVDHGVPPLAYEVTEVPVVSLETVMVAARYLGAMTVAASGNDSARVDPPHGMQIPAAYRSVIGVAASNSEHGRACFSNEGEVAAPGGEGGKRDGVECQPVLDTCSGDCKYGLISLSLSSATGYMYWTGTSFSTPLASGLAALILGQGVLSDDVSDAIRLGAVPTDPGLHLGDGIINVQNTVP